MWAQARAFHTISSSRNGYMATEEEEEAKEEEEKGCRMRLS